MPAADIKPQHGVLCHVERGFVIAIRVASASYKTEQGIGVGDSSIALASRYAIRWLDDHIAEVEDLGMMFQIEADRIIAIVIS
jgi:hypothetical protein